ncbi:MAG: RecX family transcriptional regulator [Clostridia bacterium]|nr:RecX family transcriptional regulator [Clostridia bacterium]MCR5693549.1 recombination regulator RecX [Clostridia bacterium]
MVREPLYRSLFESGERYTVEKHEKNDDGTYTVTFENGFSGVFSADEYIKYDLFADGEENRHTYAELMHDVDFARCRGMALSLAKASPKPSAAVRRTMLSKGFSDGIVDDALEALTAEGELDDSLFAERYARAKAERGKSSGSLVIRELEMKGVESDIAAKAVAKFFTDDEAVARELAVKKARNGDSYEKTARYLLSRGFRQGLVMDILEEVFPKSGCFRGN